MEYGNYREEAEESDTDCFVKAIQAMDDGISPACYWCSSPCERGTALIHETENKQFRAQMKRSAMRA